MQAEQHLKRHIHHKFIRAGLSQRQSLLCIVCIAVAYIVLNCLLLKVTCNTAVFIIDVASYVALNLVLNVFIHKREAVAA